MSTEFMTRECINYHTWTMTLQCTFSTISIQLQDSNVWLQWTVFWIHIWLLQLCTSIIKIDNKNHAMEPGNRSLNSDYEMLMKGGLDCPKNALLSLPYCPCCRPYLGRTVRLQYQILSWDEFKTLIHQIQALKSTFNWNPTWNGWVPSPITQPFRRYFTSSVMLI